VRLALVDLAGSERLAHTRLHLGAAGVGVDSSAADPAAAAAAAASAARRALEGRHINGSLSALGNCMHALKARAAHVPFRSATLTRLLAQFLAPRSKAVLVVQVRWQGGRVAGRQRLGGTAALVVQVAAVPVRRRSQCAGGSSAAAAGGMVLPAVRGTALPLDPTPNPSSLTNHH
jgi:hypothetical protein